MLVLLYRPLAWDRAALVALALMFGVALYCLAYNALSGASESLLDGLTWAAINILPFYVAFEALKRTDNARDKALCLLGAIAASLLLQGMVHGLEAPWFQFIRRLPAAALVLFLSLLAPALAVRIGQRHPAPDSPDALPLAPDEIDWVAAAGNYVEFHRAGRAILHRASLASVDALLSPHGFIRIHRSRLVARHMIARCRPTDVVLRDGTSLKTGARYRAELSATL
ncbi:LytTR family DNA-binding domain-containing protein [Sphingomonas cavernae]|uniref:LytTR family transcriptional regulator n=1 Tax=Sphingomonas cavernae TaxID=2320861 RepID=A0A418WK16_9SPHN|nr:LytTR family DNA-binding domain-containing protein [Sphingomonas cavernae]RJF90374.1 LytTR family transcriptional regulator [Sphingomonas cavernae]